MSAPDSALFDGEARRPFVVGDKVVVLSNGFTGDSVSYKDTVKTVNKKTGNFTLAQDSGQWRQSGYRAGNDPWSRGEVVHADDPRVAEAEESQRQSKVKYAFKVASEQACKADLKAKDYIALEQAIGSRSTRKERTRPFKFKPSPPKVPKQGTWRDGPDGKGPCAECGANQVFANAETRNGVPGSKAAGWFSRRHKTDHAMQEARTDREDRLRDKTERVEAQRAKTKSASETKKAMAVLAKDVKASKAVKSPEVAATASRRPATKS